jgi:5,10-methylenetetrahydromethanopterin reductase
MRLAVGFNADVPIVEIVNYAKQSDELGYEGLWMHEHSFGRDAVSMLSSVAMFTKKINLGFACLNPYTRHPIALAETLWTLNETSNGRAQLGLGSGFPMRLDLLGIKHEKPIGAIKETIELCRNLWSGSTVNHSGANFTFKNVKSLTGPAKSRIPIYIAGWKKQMLSLTGKYADGYVAKGGESTVSIKNIISDVRSAANASGRDPQDIDIAAYLLTFIADSKQEALTSARKDPFVNYMLSVQDDYLYEGTGIDPAKKKPIAENYFAGRLTESSSFVTDEMLDAFTLVGTPNDIASRVLDYKRAGLDLPILQPISMKPSDVEKVLRTGAILIEDLNIRA